ncbi:replication factor A protein 3 [Lepidopterella palustris CBS 459.81]|uniref:Replication factor A protein 3 n=1 Tax=Lepidopterella palustris CBS 459.81 TaxID=1314670 RepID=A0A8E2E4C5_9PEZI|nr:replication factor A protein 3 [Lepidopterella palustris CBS 459.81]
MTEATPRILATHLEQFQHQTVRILGKVTQLRGETAVLEAGGPLTLLLNRDSHLTLNHAVEIIGKVDANLQVKVLASTDFGTDIDFVAANAVVEATHRHREIFYEAN